jgi:RNA polymerase sigma-70 factor, ECF subfamily
MSGLADSPDPAPRLPSNEAAFGALVDPYRRELHVHCYGMLGSLQDAEDLVQETLLRAWRRRASFEGRGSLRAWLYKIATHACLDALDTRARRIVPTDLFVPADPRLPARPPEELPWLEPFPDRLLDAVVEEGADPSLQVVSRETIELAFLAAIQHLPPRQRAVLLLRDVLDWSAPEAAALLDTSVASVTSALQRARARLRLLLPDWPDRHSAAEASEDERKLLERYVAAWNRADVAGLVALLREDAQMTMPPTPSWYLGREAIGTYLRRHVFGAAATGRMKLVPTAANRLPAAAAYQQEHEGGSYRPFALMVLRVETGLVAQISGFVRPDLFGAFDLPDTVP